MPQMKISMFEALQLLIARSGRTMRFRPGKILVTVKAMDVLARSKSPLHPESSFQRMLGLVRDHVCGHWGNISKDAMDDNERAVHNNLEILSVYKDAVLGYVFCVRTEADRSATTVFLEEES